MKKIFLKISFILAVVALLSACASTEVYKDQASEQARQFVFEQIPVISSENKAYIQYTYPIILMSPIIQTYKRGYYQLCFAWELSSPQIVLIVVGTGHDNFIDWEPNRIIFRKTLDTSVPASSMPLEEINPFEDMSQQEGVSNS